MKRRMRRKKMNMRKKMKKRNKMKMRKRMRMRKTKTTRTKEKQITRNEDDVHFHLSIRNCDSYPFGRYNCRKETFKEDEDKNRK